MVDLAQASRWFGRRKQDRAQEVEPDPADVGTAFGLELSLGPAPASTDAKGAAPAPDDDGFPIPRAFGL